MTAVQALRCDHSDDRPTRGASPYATALTAYSRDRIECAVVSRGARNPAVLDTVAERDGWLSLPDGRHLCPEHAAAGKGAVA